MTAQELRIGNYYDQFGNIHQATWVTIKELSQAPEGQLWCKPIPLTEDWLKRFGFEILVGWLDVWRKDGFDRFDLTEIHDEYFFNDTHIEFVHQLQNAFFCIEQTELTPSDGGKIE